MTLVTGARLGPYEIVEAAGAGGMGEVYKASDTRLDRIVAIKVLPVHWAANAEMKQRFEREAQTLASLNHPHICVLYDIGNQAGVDFLVMEYLEGETLAARLGQGALGVDEALKVGLEIADALDKAHRRGIVHRDLKPANVMLTKSGTKLLDFGLAKFAKEGTVSPTSDSPTTMRSGTDLTSPGTVIGTLQYMAPEQLEGLEADARTDIFSFGVLLHEMITGKRAFQGKSRVLLMSAIATSEAPPVSSLEPSASPALDHVVKTCMAKEPADRWQTARDLLAELEWIAEGGAETTASAPVAAATTRRRWLTRAAFVGAGLGGGALVAFATTFWRGAPASDELRFRVPIQLAAETTTAGGRGAGAGAAQGYQGVSGPAVFNAASAAISPDGRTIAFVARQVQADPWLLYVRPVGAVTPQRLPGTEDATKPFWSADSKSIAFVSGGKMKRVEATGGPPQPICDAAGFSGGTWNKDGVILFGTAQGVYRVPAQGGKAEAITHPAESEAGHYWPQFLPDGRHYLYTVWSGQVAGRSIVAGSLDDPQLKTRILVAGSNAAYADAGYLVFHRESSVYAQPFSASKLSVSGEPTRIADQITFDSATGLGHFSVAPTGALLYFFNSTSSNSGQGSPSSDLSEWQFTWISRTAQILDPVGPPGVYRGVDVSPDTKRVAVHRHDANGGDIAVFEPRGSDTRLTFDATQHNSSPIWSPLGDAIAFASLRKGKWGLYRTLSTRSGSEELLYESDLPIAPTSWSPDSKRIVFWVQDPKTSGDLWVLPLEGDKKAVPLVATPFNEIHGQISPDGKWIAYTDDSKDGRNEIYVQPFPTPAGRYQISTNGGDWPRWRGDSRELFFHAIGNPVTPGVNAGPVAFTSLILAAPISVNGTVLEPGTPREIMAFPTLNIPHSGGTYHTYAVSPDGERFLVSQFVTPTTAASGSEIRPDTFSGLTVAINWTAGLKK
jgi:Tol biopolymer transport system component/predicted Ser/Thr protein kinase